MLINRRNALMTGGKRTPTAKDYVQDGLVAMWDGIENAGWGVHDANINGWMELVSGEISSVNVKRPTCLDDGWRIDGTRSGFARTQVSGVGHIECVFNIAVSDNTQIILPYIGTGLKFILVVKDDKLVVPLAYSGSKTVCETSGAGVRQSISIRYGQGWLNGVDATSTISVNTGYGYSYASSCIITAFAASNFADTFQYFSGDVHAIRLYSRALTADEIAANHAVDKARFNLPDAT